MKLLTAWRTRNQSTCKTMDNCTGGSKTTDDVRLKVKEAGEEKEDKSPPSPLFPRENDVLLGRHKQAYNHVGNRLFRTMVAEEAAAYFHNRNKKHRRAVANKIIKKIAKNDGRFLEQQKDGSWKVPCENAIRAKVKQALRDAAANLNQKEQVANYYQQMAKEGKRKRETESALQSTSGASAATTASAPLTIQPRQERNEIPQMMSGASPTSFLRGSSFSNFPESVVLERELEYRRAVAEQNQLALLSQLPARASVPLLSPISGLTLGNPNFAHELRADRLLPRHNLYHSHNMHVLLGHPLTAASSFDSNRGGLHPDLSIPQRLDVSVQQRLALADSMRSSTHLMFAHPNNFRNIGDATSHDRLLPSSSTRRPNSDALGRYCREGKSGEPPAPS